MNFTELQCTKDLKAASDTVHKEEIIGDVSAGTKCS